MQKKEIRILSAEDVRRCLPMEQAIEAVKSAFIQLSAGEARVPLRSRIDLNANDRALFMPVYLPRQKMTAVKTVTVFPHNGARGLPAIQAMLMVFDARDGRPLALLDGETLTAIRTGAASGLATDLLALPEAKTLALFGAGVQARSQFRAVRQVRPVERVLITDPNEARAHALVAEICRSHPDLQVKIATAKEAAQAADIICTATTSTVPVFRDEWLRPGVHINGIGSFTPEMQEIPAETVQRAALFADARAACLQEAGDILIPLKKGYISEAHIRAEIGEVAAGKAEGRKDAQEITFFKSVGNGVQDLAAAAVVLRNAEKQGTGRKIKL